MSTSNVMKKVAATGMAALMLVTGAFGAISADNTFAAKKVPLKKITLSKTSAKVQQGKSFKLKVKYTPKNTTVKKTVKWTSSKTSVATVKSGKVTAKKPGKATITAKVGGKKATCKITVTKMPDTSRPDDTKPDDNKPDEGQQGGDNKDQPAGDQQDGDQKDTDQSDYADPSEAYSALNSFRTSANVWEWNKDDTTKTYYNTNSSNTLKALQRDGSLENTAKIRAKEIAEKFSHTRPDGTSCFTAYPTGFMAMGENIAYGYDSGSKITELWEETNEKYEGQGHRRNMLNSSFNAVGIAGYKKNGTTYWVQAFGGR